MFRVVGLWQILPLCMALLMLLGCVPKGVRTNSQHASYEAPRSTSKKNFPIPGRYVGFARLEDSNLKLPMTIDLLGARAKKTSAKYQAVLRWDLGSFQSDEYFSQFQSELNYDLKTRKLNGMKADDRGYVVNDLRLKGRSVLVGHISDKSGKKVSRFLVLHTGSHRKKSIQRSIAKVFPEHDVFPRLSGTYAGDCSGKKTRLDLSSIDGGFVATDRSQAEFPRVVGRWGREDRVRCSGKSTLCVTSLISGGGLDPFSTKLTLKGMPKDKVCSYRGTEITCGECSLERGGKGEGIDRSLFGVAAAPQRPKQVAFSNDTKLPMRPDFPGAVEGEYFGYLYHEGRQLYQLLRLKVSAETVQEDGMRVSSLAVDGVATLFFGDSNSREYLVYQFQPRLYSDSAPYFIFGGKSEVLFQVSSWHEGGIRGVWYSKNWGRVGSVELLRGRISESPDSRELVSQVSGTYQAKSRRFNLVANSNLSTSQRDIYPLSVRGLMTSNGSPPSKKVVKRLSYDFYAGQLAMQLEDGRVAIGSFDEDKLRIYWPDGFRFGSTFDGQVSEQFFFEKNPFAGTTARQMYDLMKLRYLY